MDERALKEFDVLCATPVGETKLPSQGEPPTPHRIPAPRDRGRHGRGRDPAHADRRRRAARDAPFRRAARAGPGPDREPDRRGRRRHRRPSPRRARRHVRVRRSAGIHPGVARRPGTAPPGRLAPGHDHRDAPARPAERQRRAVRRGLAERRTGDPRRHRRARRPAGRTDDERRFRRNQDRHGADRPDLGRLDGPHPRCRRDPRPVRLGAALVCRSRPVVGAECPSSPSRAREPDIGLQRSSGRERR